MSSYLQVDDRHPELCVIDKFLGAGDVADICSKLTAAKKRVVLKGNCLGVAGASSLATFLKDNSSIQHLSLEWNQLGNDGTIAIARAIETSQVVELDLRNNNIKSEGASALAKSIMVNSTITSLDLRWNQIEDGAALEFREALQDRVPALQLKISGNLLSTDVSNTLEKWQGKQDAAFQEEKESAPSNNSSSSTNAVARSANGNVGSSSSSGSGGTNREFTGPSAASIEAQSSILAKETAVLRSQNTTLHGECRDLQRQLDTAAVRVTELEQQYIKEEHRGNHLSEQLKSANMRVAMQMEELKNLTGLWEQDRQANAAEMKRLTSEQDVQLRSLSTERDRARDALRKVEDKSDRLTIQLEQITLHTTQERETAQAELALAHSQLTELTTSEAKLKGENAILKNSQTRYNERISQLETEIEFLKKQSAADLAEEFKVRGEEMDRVRSEFASQANIAQEKISRQTRELAELYKKHAELQAETTTQRVAMQEASEANIAAIRESEAKRCEATVQEMKARLDAYLASREEVETRCQGLSREVRQSQEQHAATSEQFTKQFKEMETELRRLREQKLQMESSMATAQKDAQASHAEKDAAFKKFADNESMLADTQRSLQQVVMERGSLRSQVAQLEQQLEAFDLQRRTEFATITEQMTLTVRNQLDALKANFLIRDAPAPPSDNASSKSPAAPAAATTPGTGGKKAGR